MLYCIFRVFSNMHIIHIVHIDSIFICILFSILAKCILCVLFDILLHITYILFCILFYILCIFPTAVPPSTSDIEPQYPPVWPSQPSLPSNSAAAYAAHHIARNISGDAAWPPGRPPSSGSDSARVGADPALMTARAQSAWSKAVQSVSQSELDSDAALREALAITKPRAAVPQVSLPTPFPAFAPDAVPANLGIEIFKDPEASATKCEISRSVSVAARPRSLTNAAANRQWRMNQPPRELTLINRDDCALQREETSLSAVVASLRSPTLQVRA